MYCSWIQPPRRCRIPIGDHRLQVKRTGNCIKLSTVMNNGVFVIEVHPCEGRTLQLKTLIAHATSYNLARNIVESVFPSTNVKYSKQVKELECSAAAAGCWAHPTDVLGCRAASNSTHRSTNAAHIHSKHTTHHIPVPILHTFYTFPRTAHTLPSPPITNVQYHHTIYTRFTEIGNEIEIN